MNRILISKLFDEWILIRIALQEISLHLLYYRYVRYCIMRNIIISILLIFICVTSFVSAQELKIGKEELLDIPLSQLLDFRVIGVSKFTELKSDAPAIMVVITEEQIRSRGYFDLSDLLKDIPGIDIVDNARGYGEYYTIKGIEGNDRFSYD